MKGVPGKIDASFLKFCNGLSPAVQLDPGALVSKSLGGGYIGAYNTVTGSAV